MYISYSNIIANLFRNFNRKYQFKKLNGEIYVTKEKKILKAVIELRCKSNKFAFLNEGDITNVENDGDYTRKEKVINKINSYLLLSAQELFILLYLIHIKILGISEIDINKLQQNLRHKRKIKSNKQIDKKILEAYKLALFKLQNREIHIEIDKNASKIYGISNIKFSQRLVIFNENNEISLGELEKILLNSCEFSEMHMPEKCFEFRNNQIIKLLIAYNISYQIFKYEKNWRVNSYEINMVTLMNFIPSFYKNGINSGISILEKIENSKSKTQMINRFYFSCLEILELYKKENIIKDYSIAPIISKICVKNYKKIKFCLKIRG